MSSTSLSTWDTSTVSWVVGTAAVMLSVGRFLIRWKLMSGFRADDWAHLLATVILIASLALFSGFIPLLNATIAYESGETDVMPDIVAAQAGSIASSVLFFTGLWAVKISFLLFYRSLFKTSPRFAVAWWIALVYNVVTFWVCFAGIMVQCGGSAQYLLNIDVCNNEFSANLAGTIFIFQYVCIVSSDLVTMILPLAMLHQLQMRSGLKMAISGLFCLSLVCIAFETLRLVESLQGTENLNALWLNLEQTVAVIVSALPSYYALVNLTKEHRSTARYATSAQLYKSGDKIKSPLQSRSMGRYSRALELEERKLVQQDGNERPETIKSAPLPSIHQGEAWEDSIIKYEVEVNV